MADQPFRIIAALDNHFAAADQLPADAARWRELKRHVIRMKEKDGLGPRAPRARERRSADG